MAKKAKLQIIPLGGLGEIGKNMTAISYGDTIVVIDSGLAFPDDELLGIDLVIPDISFLVENQDKVKAILLTHGHEDHVGGLPYVLRQITPPIYGSRLTLGIVEGKLKEHHLKNVQLNVVQPRDKIQIGPLDIEFFRVCHSIPDCMGIAIHTPLGVVLHTGDIKLDLTPVDGQTVDFSKLGQLGEKGVLVMMGDSTNAERSGTTKSEKVVGAAFDELFGRCAGRIIITTFASNVHRVQQAINTAAKYDRKVAVVGRSMENNVKIAMKLGYLNVPENTLIDMADINKYAPEKLAIATTGSQGEPMSALTRMATADHRWVSIKPGDTVIISASAIPGNEKLIGKTIDLLFKQGANVVYDRESGVHVSGHASQGELKLLFNIIKPRFFIPVHGEYRHQMKHAQLAESMGIPKERICVAENGNIIEVSHKKIQVVGKVTAGRVMIDGLGIGDVGNVVIRDRKQLSQDGIMIVVVTLSNGELVTGPDIVSRGFIYVRESEQLMELAKAKVNEALEHCSHKNLTEWAIIKSQIREKLGKFLYEKTGRRPMIMPIILEP